MLLGGASCGGSGCSGCVPGSASLPGGFPVASAVPSVGALRITRSGLDQLGASASQLASSLGAAAGAGGTLSIPIPTSTTSGSVSLFGFPLPYSISICPNGPSITSTPPECEANVMLTANTLHLDAVTPNAIAISGNIPIRLQDLPLNASLIGDFAIGFGQGSCNGGIPNFDYGTFPVSITLPIVAETAAPRAGVSKIDVANADVEITAPSSALGVCKDCGTNDFICEPVLDAVKSLAFGLVTDQVKSQIKAQLQTAFCTAPDPTVTPACPTGSSADSSGATCVYDASPMTCVPTLLGTDGRIDASSLLGGGIFSSATASDVDFRLAAGGALDPAPASPADNTGYAGHTPNGATFALVGGVLPETVSPCVPAFTNVAPTGIPLPDALTVDTVSNWPSGQSGPDLGFALSARYLDYALGSVYQSGALCVDVKGGTVSELNTGLLSLLAPSVKGLTFEGNAATIEARLRPQLPPTVTVGSGADNGANALVTVHATDFAVDLYIYSDDRYVRALTFESNVTLPVGITTGVSTKNPNGGLLPTVGTATFDDPRVLNSELLTESPASLAGGVSLALSALIGQLLGNNFPAIDLSSALSTFGLSLTIPQAGIQKVSQGADDFVAIFGALSPATGTTGKRAPGGTRIQITHLDIHPEAMSLTTARRDLLPRASLALIPADTAPREYAWWLDAGPRSPWSTNRNPVVTGDEFFLQAKHTLWVTSRLVGKPESEEEPVATPLLIDVLAPQVSFVQPGGGTDPTSATRWTASDFVSAASDLRARVRIDGGAWSEWSDLPSAQSSSALGESSGGGVEVEVRDEAGNVGSASWSAVTGAAAGNARVASSGAAPDGSVTDSDGGCSTSGRHQGQGDTGGALVMVAIAALFVGARRTKEQNDKRSSKRSAAALSFGASVTAATAAAVSGFGAVACGGDTLDLNVAATDASVTTDAGIDAALSNSCGSDCKQPCKPGLDRGLVGAYASLAQAPDGTVWVAAYSDAVIKGANIQSYGDLVVGRYVAANGAVAWSSVDGVPALAAGTCADNYPAGWRRGITAAGDDVGLWTSLAIGGANQSQPMVAYYDSTHAALRFASFDGTTWSSHAITPPSTPGVEDDGRYAKVAIVGGVPIVAYLFQTGSGASGKSGVRLATAKTATPRQPSDWTIEEVASGSGATDPTLPLAYPTAYGDYVSLASGVGGVAIVFYDQPNGNLVGAKRASSGTGWTTTILDGAPAASAADTRDVGSNATVAIDASGDWRVAYVDANAHQLLYMKVAGGVTTSTPQVVDDGSSVGGVAFDDGVHLVGDDARISLDASGTPKIVYGDSTAGTLRIASAAQTGASGVFKWTLAAPPQPGKFAGIAPNALPDGSKIGNAYREVDDAGETQGDVVFVAAP